MPGRGKRAAAMVVDRALAVAAPLIARRARADIPVHPRVLVIRCDHIGDVAMSTAVLQPIRAGLQPSRLDVLVGPWGAPLLEQHPAIDRVITYATPWWLAARGASRAERLAAWARLPALVRGLRDARYDIAIDLRGDLRQILFFLALARVPTRVSSDRTGGQRLLTHVARFDPDRHTVEDMAAIVGTLGVRGPAPAVLDLGPLPALPDAIERRLAAHEGSGGLMVLALRGTDANREWPAEHAAALADRAAAERGLATVIVGGPGESPLASAVAARANAPVLDVTGQLTLRELATLCRRGAVTVAVDSGPMHIAAAAGGPVVGLFGIGVPTRIGPWGPRTTIATVGAPCGCAPPTCRFGPGAGRCMRTLTPDIVMRAMQSVAGG
jgi:heptosyltransferase-3